MIEMMSARRPPKSNGARTRRAAPPGRPKRGYGSGGSAKASTLFPRLGEHGARFGVGVLVAVAEVAGRKPEVRQSRREAFESAPGRRPRERLLRTVDVAELARALGGLAHAQRVRIACAILSGANTHHGLEKATGLRPGPLYHHLRALERAGLLTCVDRNRYDLSGRGRDLLLVATVAHRMKQRAGEAREIRSSRSGAFGGAGATNRNGKQPAG